MKTFLALLALYFSILTLCSHNSIGVKLSAFILLILASLILAWRKER